MFYSLLTVFAIIVMFLPILIHNLSKMKKEKEKFYEEWVEKTKDYDPLK
ncbi:hypothetical protein [Alkalihalobacterium chitinilyticum]|uniref:Uncharacterized protein n=1 Tax=Alkalihalobacterium chitinilyticum TaxID=2980103 RepID=A0ABT5VD54_9BACI|nr:hypothetical protein [Alkalihalobacterium chitinilyticum]MDE5413378.1 hypothetical protein [Alkalihalobacterium chitinilyticum]